MSNIIKRRLAIVCAFLSGSLLTFAFYTAFVMGSLEYRLKAECKDRGGEPQVVRNIPVGNRTMVYGTIECLF